jgi:hypothetical protein
MLMALLAIGGILGIIGFVWLVILGFSESVLWGVGNLLLPLCAGVFGVLHWHDAKIPTILYGIGVAVNIIVRVAS